MPRHGHNNLKTQFKYTKRSSRIHECELRRKATKRKKKKKWEKGFKKKGGVSVVTVTIKKQTKLVIDRHTGEKGYFWKTNY